MRWPIPEGIADDLIIADLYTYRVCPVHTAGRAGTNLGRAAGRDLIMGEIEGLEHLETAHPRGQRDDSVPERVVHLGRSTCHAISSRVD